MNERADEQAGEKPSVERILWPKGWPRYRQAFWSWETTCDVVSGACRCGIVHRPGEFSISIGPDRVVLSRHGAPVPDAQVMSVEEKCDDPHSQCKFVGSGITKRLDDAVARLVLLEELVTKRQRAGETKLASEESGSQQNARLVEQLRVQDETLRQVQVELVAAKAELGSLRLKVATDETLVKICQELAKAHHHEGSSLCTKPTWSHAEALQIAGEAAGQFTSLRQAYHEIEYTLGGALYGYAREKEDDPSSLLLPCWGDHVAETLAEEAANEIREKREKAKQEGAKP